MIDLIERVRHEGDSIGGIAEIVATGVPAGWGEPVFDKLKADLVSQQPLLAPVSAGQRVGTLKIMLESKRIGEYPVVALENVAVAGFFGRAWDTVRLWFQ